MSHDKNPIDDSERVVLSLRAHTGTSTRGEPITFIARCQSNETEAFINWNEHLGNDSYDVYNEYKYVIIRIGNDEAQSQKWEISTDSEAVFAPDWAGDLLKQMAKAETFLAQLTPYNESPITAIFDTSGMAAALKPLAKTCGWLETLERKPGAEAADQPAPAEPTAEQEFERLLRSVEEEQQTAGPRQELLCAEGIDKPVCRRVTYY